MIVIAVENFDVDARLRPRALVWARMCTAEAIRTSMTISRIMIAFFLRIRQKVKLKRLFRWAGVDLISASSQ